MLHQSILYLAIRDYRLCNAVICPKRKCNGVERLCSTIKHAGDIATRLAKLASRFPVGVLLVGVLIWRNRRHAPGRVSPCDEDFNLPTVVAGPETIARAGDLLRAGALVAFPTETVYGLGADATNGRAVAAIYEAKGRPSFNPLIAHVASLAAAERVGAFSALARRLATAFWPGPLTLVVPRVPDCAVSELATAGLDSIAVRVPSHPVALVLLRAAGRPIAAPSANRSGHVSPTTAAHVAADLAGRVAMILDGGATEVGVESTVLDVTASVPRLLRPGGVTREQIEQLIGPIVMGEADPLRPSSPGQLESHYAPRAGLRLDAVHAGAGEALLAFGARVPACSGPVINLSAAGDLAEAAANLFAALRRLDASGTAMIAVMPVQDTGLGAAINDRLRRAAAPRGAR